MRLDEDRRERASAWLEEGLPTSVVAVKTGCSIRTVQRLARELDEAKRHGCGSKPKIDDGENAPEQRGGTPSHTFARLREIARTVSERPTTSRVEIARSPRAKPAPQSSALSSLGRQLHLQAL